MWLHTLSLTAMCLRAGCSRERMSAVICDETRLACDVLCAWGMQREMVLWLCKNNCLVDPASSICLFQRLSHACLSTVVFTRRYRGRLIKSVVVQMGPSSRYTWITVVIPELIHATHIPRWACKSMPTEALIRPMPNGWWCALCARTAAARINGDSG